MSKIIGGDFNLIAFYTGRVEADTLTPAQEEILEDVAKICHDHHVSGREGFKQLFNRMRTEDRELRPTHKALEVSVLQNHYFEFLREQSEKLEPAGIGS